MDIYELGSHHRIRNIPNKSIDKICFHYQENENGVLRIYAHLEGVTLRCGRCNSLSSLLRAISYDINGILTIAKNPYKYLTKDETIVCIACTRSVQNFAHYNFMYQLKSRFQKNTISPSFQRTHDSDLCNAYYIYNRKYNYYMSVSLFPSSNLDDFVIRASNFKKYDPYRVAYITLFDIALLHLEI